MYVSNIMHVSVCLWGNTQYTGHVMSSILTVILYIPTCNATCCSGICGSLTLPDISDHRAKCAQVGDTYMNQRVYKANA